MSSRDSFPDIETISVARGPAAFSASTFELRVIEGPDTGLLFRLDAEQPARCLVGKGPVCDVRLTDPQVSRRHLSLELQGRRIRVRDLGSTNGTFVDGVSIIDGHLRGGEVLRMGQTAFLVAESGPVQEVKVPMRVQFGRLIGSSLVMRRLYPLCERLAATDVPVVIEGETGTGKEQLAESLHDMSPRSAQPFVVFDCTAVAPSLIESELFGHERGAFTGSLSTRRGVFERAHGGTLLIDEIGDLPMDLQPKLLRAIERGEVTRVGGERPIKVDVRLLFATRRDLDRQVALGHFRDDLYHRISVTRLELPPLREREGDVRLLAYNFTAQLGADPEELPRDLVHRWEAYEWPGNVRELRNAVARWVALGDMDESLSDRPPPPSVAPPLPPASSSGGTLPSPGMMPLGRAPGSIPGPPSVPRMPPQPSSSPPLAGRGDPIARLLSEGLPLAEARQKLIDEFESRYVEHLIDQHGGNVTRAAAAAGVARRHLQRLRAKQRG